MLNNAKYTFVSPSFLGDRPIATEARLATFFSLLIELVISYLELLTFYTYRISILPFLFHFIHKIPRILVSV